MLNLCARCGFIFASWLTAVCLCVWPTTDLYAEAQKAVERRPLVERSLEDQVRRALGLLTFAIRSEEAALVAGELESVKISV